jgi:tetratricopeptide (TPR) repeat protein
MITAVRRRLPLKMFVLLLASGLGLAVPCLAQSAAPAPSPAPLADEAAYAAGANAEKAHELVTAAINMTDSDRAVQLLWQATQLDPTLDEPYMYLALYYDSRSQFDKVVEVYQKLLKFHPKEATAYINIGEAYMSFTPARYEEALPYYLKAFQLDPSNSFAALRIGEAYLEEGNRGQALRYLKLASSDPKNPTAAAEAAKVLRQIGPS